MGAAALNGNDPASEEVKKAIAESIESAKNIVTTLWESGEKFDRNITCAANERPQDFLLPLEKLEFYIRRCSRQAENIGDSTDKCFGSLSSIQQDSSLTREAKESIIDNVTTTTKLVAKFSMLMEEANGELCQNFNRLLDSGFASVGQSRRDHFRGQADKFDRELKELQKKSENRRAWNGYNGDNLYFDDSGSSKPGGGFAYLANWGVALAAKIHDPYESDIQSKKTEKTNAEDWVDSYNKQRKELVDRARGAAPKFRNDLDTINLVWKTILAGAQHLQQDILPGFKAALDTPSMVSEKMDQAIDIYSRIALFSKSPVFEMP
ncbi:hypothetical protein Micbo1qcDRAFT_161528 [Microdochium bolleyi]|uniref:Uncharacterized protein n=1 Tax=Microdochium bolleyi TaxID=196109 RepID=A0A136J8Q8_9PEZI|nr:hypothetical protein Micbo1qcDRAFT_161528 [Microdochium bolleyi]